MRKFLQNDKGAIAIMFAILMPFLIYILWLGFDGSNALLKHSRLDDASREANLASSTLKDKSQKEDVAQKFLFAYFNEDVETKPEKFKEIEIEDENNTRKKAHELTVSLNDKTILLPDKTQDQEYKIDTSSIVEEGNLDGNGGNTDYVFAIDFSSSMRFNSDIFKNEEINRLCATIDEDYDATFCNRINRANVTNLNIAQAVLHKTLKILAKYSADTVQYSIIPFNMATQINRRYDYTIGDTKASSKQLSTPYILREKYRLKDMKEYDKYSGMPPLIRQNNRYILPSIPSDDSNKKIFEALVNEIFRDGDFENVHFFNAKLGIEFENLIDYRDSIIKMFDLKAGFGFRFSAADAPNPLWYINKQPPVNFFPYRSSVLEDFDAVETPLKSLKKIEDYDEEPVIDADDLRTLYTKNAGGLTEVMIGLMRGAAHLARGKHPRRVLMLITDAETRVSGLPTSLTPIGNNFIDFGVCNAIREGLKAKGASNVEIKVLVIGLKKLNAPFLRDMSKCIDEKDIVFAENLESFFKSVKSFALGEGKNSKFIYRNIKK